jgi:hypothetical protein
LITQLTQSTELTPACDERTVPFGLNVYSEPVVLNIYTAPSARTHPVELEGNTVILAMRVPTGSTVYTRRGEDETWYTKSPMPTTGDASHEPPVGIRHPNVAFGNDGAHGA